MPFPQGEVVAAAVAVTATVHKTIPSLLSSKSDRNALLPWPHSVGKQGLYLKCSSTQTENPCKVNQHSKRLWWMRSLCNPSLWPEHNSRGGFGVVARFVGHVHTFFGSYCVSSWEAMIVGLSLRMIFWTHHQISAPILFSILVKSVATLQRLLIP